MRLAQQLYEGVDIKDIGTIGLITYLRTDSTRVSEEAERMAYDFIEAQYGSAYNRKEDAGEKKQTARFRMRMRRSGRPISPACPSC